MSMGRPETAFLFGALRVSLGAMVRSALHYGVGRMFRWRSSEVVGRAYDRHRAQELHELSSLSLEDVVLSEQQICDYVLMEDRIVWSTGLPPRVYVLERLRRAVEAYVPLGGTVVEFGSGDGRNLLYLKQQFPQVRCIGLEVSPVSVELSRRLASKFGLEVDFYPCNVCAPLPADLKPHRAELVFSCFALEMMPRIFRQGLNNMGQLSTGHIVLIEPIPELWPWNLRGWISRLRVLALDRLRGAMPVLKTWAGSSGWRIDSTFRLKTAHNPLNEGCEVHLTRRN